MAYIYLIPIDDDAVKIGSHSGHLGKLVKRYQTSILKENIAQGWAYKIEDNAKLWAEGIIATLIKRKQDLIGWIEGEKYDKDVSETFHLLASDLCLPNTKTSIASVIIASVERQEEKLAKKEKQQKDREYMRQVREDLREKAQEAKEQEKMERQTRQAQKLILAQERSENISATNELDRKQQLRNLITFLQLPTEKNGIKYEADKYCLWTDLKSHLFQKQGYITLWEDFKSYITERNQGQRKPDVSEANPLTINITPKKRHFCGVCHTLLYKRGTCCSQYRRTNRTTKNVVVGIRLCCKDN